MVTTFLEIQMGATQFCGISRGEASNLKIPEVIFKKVCPQPPCLDFFWNSPLLTAGKATTPSHPPLTKKVSYCIFDEMDFLMTPSALLRHSMVSYVHSPQKSPNIRESSWKKYPSPPKTQKSLARSKQQAEATNPR